MLKQALEIALYGASLVTSVFGALTFPVLVLLYAKTGKRRSPVLLAFTIALTVLFVLNLTSQIEWIPSLGTALRVTSSILPALIFHLMVNTARDVRGPRFWHALVIAAYPASLVVGWNEPGIALAGGAGLALAVQLSSRGPLRAWIAVILACLAGASAISVSPNAAPLFTFLPDYFVLALFCITLYYEERLVFFDLVIKRGAMFLVALTGLTALSLVASEWLGDAHLDWRQLWIGALALTPFWMAAPWIYQRLANFLDRAWLGRRYSMEDAEMKFSQDVQVATSESDLRERSAASLSEIFGSNAEVCFDAEPNGAAEMTANLMHEGVGIGKIGIGARASGAMFLSDDHRLLRSLARTLAVVLQNVRSREREQGLRHAASRAELKALRAQINPHFLFNALNAVAGLIVEDPQLADETIERLARVFRYGLSKSENEWVRLDEEMDFIEAYLRIEQARFGKRLRIEIDVERSAREVLIPAITIQPLVENAIKHGVSMSEDPGLVIVRAGITGDVLRIEVFDSGPGFDRDFSIGHGGHALRNISDRLSGYYGSSGRLSWRSDRGGNRVFVEIPAARILNAAPEYIDANSDR